MLIGAEGARLVRKCKNRIFSCGAFSAMIIQRPAGAAGQVRPHRRFSAEEAHRTPRGKRAPRDRQRAPVTAMFIQRTTLCGAEINIPILTETF
jgi:hypothetical protein